jgi:putative peptidoglycan binding protein
MKRLVIALSCLGLCGFNVSNAFGKSGGNSSSDSAPPPPALVHHGASAPVAAPIGAGVPHNFSGSTSYRPMTTVHGNGQRTLVYPGVRNSTIHQPTSSNLNGVRTGGQQGTGKLHSPSGIATVNKTKLDPQTSTRLRNWSGGVSTTAQAHQINTNNHHHHHDHDWWKHHCVALIFFDWGWWGWYDGWWYPAWDYDPYSSYPYNDPIYGYGDFTPDQIVAGVQAKLQQLGYYTYAIDGKMGPLTQGAIARYQRDHHMSITSGIDPATLGSLGIIH